ncbi:MAG TPA: hypothetical protein VFU36_04840, partial [Jatrophihabitans sp.]|nr:hypothetical protein [Jatrophihabitans sp.]
IDRLDAQRPIADELGPRDVGRLAPAIRCPVLIAHGRLDDRIPVDQARAIVSAITSGSSAARLRYLELPDRGHAVLSPHPDDDVLRAAIALLAGTEQSAEPAARPEDVLPCPVPSFSEGR